MKTGCRSHCGPPKAFAQVRANAGRLSIGVYGDRSNNVAGLDPVLSPPAPTLAPMNDRTIENAGSHLQDTGSTTRHLPERLPTARQLDVS
jgi:hypothetical protein